MPLFQKDKYVKVFDVQGNYHFGYIAAVKDRGYILVVSLDEEGLSKINYEAEHIFHTGGYTRDFNEILTDIEKRLVQLLACGLSTRDIGCQMEVSPVTVRAHIRDLKLKLQLETREQLVAYSQGIVTKLGEIQEQVRSQLGGNGGSPVSDVPAGIGS